MTTLPDAHEAGGPRRTPSTRGVRHRGARGCLRLPELRAETWGIRKRGDAPEGGGVSTSLGAAPNLGEERPRVNQAGPKERFWTH